MAIRIGVAGVPFSAKDRSTISGIERCAELGLDAMEVQFVRGVNMGAQTAEQVRKVSEEKKISLSVHAPYFINLNGSQATVEASIQRILDSARMAKTMNAGIVVVHAAYYGKPGPGMPDPKEEALKNVIDAVKKIEQVLENEKNEVRIGLETMGRQSQFGTVEEILEVCRSCGQTFPVIDFAHIHARYNGILKDERDYEKILEGVEKWNAEYSEKPHCHFAGIHFVNGNERNHLELSSNSPPFKPLARLLVSKKFEPTIICESPILEKDAVMMKSIIASAQKI